MQLQLIRERDQEADLLRKSPFEYDQTATSGQHSYTVFTGWTMGEQGVLYSPITAAGLSDEVPMA